MLKLMKYEARKTRFSRLVLLVLTVLAELTFLAGLFWKKENGIAAGIMGLSFCAMFGLFYTGIESIMTLHRDLNTKQSYMLFLIPRSSYQILGAKILTSGISVFLTGLLFAVLAVSDICLLLRYQNELQTVLAQVRIILSGQVDWQGLTQWLLLCFMVMLAFWLFVIVTGYFSVVLSATVLAGKKLGILVSILIFIGLSELFGKVESSLPPLKGWETGAWMGTIAMQIGVIFAFTALVYFITGWIMEKRLSV